MTRDRCPSCEHFEHGQPCPYLDHVGNLIGTEECPTVCGKPATHTVFLPVGKLPLCKDHFTTVTRQLMDTDRTGDKA